MRMERANEAGHSLRDPALLAVARVEAVSGLSPTPWTGADEAAIRGEAARRLSEHAHAAVMLGSASDRLVAGIELVSYLERGGPFGPAWAGHAFASSAMNASYKLREPDVTRELKSLMEPDGGRRASLRAVAFLRALTELAGAEATRATLTDRTRPAVTAEHQIAARQRRTRGRAEAESSAATRIDLLFAWPTGTAGQNAVVVVEAKLGSTVSEGQLRPYYKEAKRLAKGGPFDLILLTAWADPAERLHRAWKPVRWFRLLRRWEAALADAGDDGSEFARVRAHLWRFVLSSRRALQ